MNKKIISGQNLNLTIDEKQVKLQQVERAYGDFLTALGYDWEHDSNMKGTPYRVAKMYLNEVTKGSYDPEPKITSFENQLQYDGIVFQGNITIKSLCSHHMQPFVGKAHVAYIPDINGKVIGLSKLNRICDYFARRPQLQEQLTMQIHDYIDKVTEKNKGIAVLIEAEHMCVKLRGIEHDSMMKTAKLSGYFWDNPIGTREEFYRMVADLKANK